MDSLQTDGRIKSLEMHGIQKRYSPEKHYVSVSLSDCSWLWSSTKHDMCLCNVESENDSICQWKENNFYDGIIIAENVWNAILEFLRCGIERKISVVLRCKLATRNE